MLSSMRDRETIASELRLIAALRWTAAVMAAPAPRIEVADQLLDEWIAARRTRSVAEAMNGGA